MLKLWSIFSGLLPGCHFNACLWNAFLISLDVDRKVTFKTSNAVISWGPNTENCSWYTVSPLVSVLDLENDSWFLSLALARDASEDREVYFGGFNVVPSQSFAFSAERRAELISEDDTLVFSDSNMFVFTPDTVGLVLSVWHSVNDSF